jgi:hypothetical protein
MQWCEFVRIQGDASAFPARDSPEIDHHYYVIKPSKSGHVGDMKRRHGRTDLLQSAPFSDKLLA